MKAQEAATGCGNRESRPPMVKIRPCPGFTLIEIMIVVAIIGLTALVAIPTFTSHEDQQKLSMAAAELTDGLRYARSEAIRTGSTFRVTINADSDRFIIADLAAQPGQIVTHPISRKPYKVDFPSTPRYRGIHITGSGEILIDFHGNGRADNDEVITLAYGPFTAVVTVESSSGRITSS
jgi:type II secretion system protein H